jgi:hypothetical protein
MSLRRRAWAPRRTRLDVGHASYPAHRLPHAQLQMTPGTDALWFTDSPELLRHALDFLRR